jgi:hypothetical protein
MSAAAPIANERPAAASRTRFAAAQPLAIALAVTVILTALRLSGTVDSDVAWQLWIANRIHAGANLYRDIIETNPPLWFWMALPVDRIASLLHLRPEAVLILAIGGSVALALAATERLIRHVAPQPRALLLGYAALCLMAMPWMHLGQREQIVLIGTIPYAALVAARREQRPVSILLATLIGIGAALGFALKHYFLIVPALLECWLLTRNGKWRVVRPETLAIGVAGLAYAAAVLLFEPDYVTTIVPLLRLAYGEAGAPSLRYLFGPSALIGLVMLALVAAHARYLRSKQCPFAGALAAAAVGFAAAYFVQFRGWAYHAIPLLGCASLALAAMLAEVGAPMRVLRILAPALLALPLFVTAEEAIHAHGPNPDVLGAVSGLHAGDTVGFLTTETAIPWSVTLQGGYRYASRYNGFWMMPAIARNQQRANPDPRLSELGRRIVSETVDDFACMPPRRIIVWRSRNAGDGSDILPFFLHNPRFAALLAHYHERSRTSLETFELVSPLPPPRGRCRSGVGRSAPRLVFL